MSEELLMRRLKSGERLSRVGEKWYQEKRPTITAGNEEEDKRRNEVIDRVRKQLFARASAELLSRRDPESKKQIIELIRELVEQEGADLPRLKRGLLVTELSTDVWGYGPIQPFIEDDTVTEIMVNRFDQVYIERNGKVIKTDVRFRNDEHVKNVIQKIVGPLGRRVDESMPMVDARLPDGSRVNAVIPPLAIDGSNITIRKFGRRLNIDDLIQNGTASEETFEFLRMAVRGKLNILISGGTGSGKTTLLNVLSSFIPDEERIVTIEDAAELRLQQEHVVRLEARPPNIEGKGEIPIRTLVKNALRMRPDRIVVGECRGGEALDMLQAMNTGHDGSMTTLHANSPRDAVARLEVMVLLAGQELPHRAIREQVASAVDLIVQIARLRDGTRRITHISEVVGLNSDGSVDVRDIYEFRITGESEGRIIGGLVRTGYHPAFLPKLAWQGIHADKFFEGGEG